MTESKRTQKSPRQRAEEALGIAQRKVAKAEKRVSDTHTAWETARADLDAARRRLAYVAADPALPQPAAPELPDPDEEQAS